MAKWDISKMDAEAQARETALKVALDKIERMEAELRAWRVIAILVIGGVIVGSLAAVLA